MQISDAAEVIGTTRKAIQKWLEGNQIPWLAHARTGSPGKPAKFGVADIFRMRLVAELLGHGCNVKQAAWLVPHIVDKELVDSDIPFFMELFGTAIVSRRRDGPGQWRVTIGTHEAEAVAQHLKEGPAPARITINLRDLFQEVLDRIAELESKRAA